MARRRNKYGQYTKSRSRSKSRRRKSSRSRKRKGMGSVITLRRGLGQLDAETLLPPLVGGGAAMLTSLGIRWMVDPSQGSTQQMLVKWAPLFGAAVGTVASLAMAMMGGTGPAASAFLSSTVVSVFGLGSDYVLKEKGGSVLAALVSGGDLVALPPDTDKGAEGVGAIVPEYSGGMGAIVMEPTGPGGQRAGTIGAYGDVVSLQGINTNAFGTPGFAV